MATTTTATTITTATLNQSVDALKSSLVSATDPKVTPTLKDRASKLADLVKIIKTLEDNIGKYKASTADENKALENANTTLAEARKFAGSIRVGDVRDALENALTDWITTNITNTTVATILTVFVLIFQTLCFVAIVLIYMSNSLQRWIPEQIRTSSVWKMINKTPFFIFILLIILSTPFLYLTAWSSRLIDYILLVLGIMLVVYSLVMSRECRRYMLLVAGVLICVFTLTRMGLVGLETITRTGIFALVCNWVYLIVILLAVFDYYLFAPQCRQQTALGEGCAISGSVLVNGAAASYTNY